MYITTFTGRHVNPLDMSPDDVVVEDIAHALSQQCRFTGHTRLPLSVAEHSLNVCILCREGDKLAGLLHDASEAYLVDLPSPVKHAPEMAFFVEVERRLQAVIRIAFGITHGCPSVHAADKLALGIEARDLMNGVMDDPNWDQWIDPVRDYTLNVREPMSPKEAEMHFLVRYYSLAYKRNARGGSK